METHSHVGGEGRAVIGEERQRRLKRLSGRTAKQRQGVGVRCWWGGVEIREKRPEGPEENGANGRKARSVCWREVHSLRISSTATNHPCQINSDPNRR